MHLHRTGDAAQATAGSTNPVPAPAFPTANRIGTLGAPVAPAPAPRVSLPASLGLATLAALAVVAAGTLRSLHDATPHLEVLGPFGSPLFLATAGLLALHLTHRRRGLDRVAVDGSGTGLSLAHVVPLLVAVFGEKWISIDVLDGAYDWIWQRVPDPAVADALYRAWTGLALLGTALALLPILRQVRPRIARYLAVARARRALLLGGVGAVATGGMLALLTGVAGAGWVYAPAALGLPAAAQIVRGTVEELFYRGLLQTALVRLLAQAGLPDRRTPRLAGIAVVSVAFALEHFNPALPLGLAVRRVMFVVAMSVALGTLLEVSRNLYLAMAAHVALNLLVIGAIPLPAAADGLPLLPPDVAGLFFIVTLFFGVVFAHRQRIPA